MSRAKAREAAWTSPLDFSRYDRQPTLTDSELRGLDIFLNRRQRSSWQADAFRDLPRLFIPLQDALSHLSTHPVTRTKVCRLLLTQMQQRQTSFWAWQEADWMEVFEVARQVPYRVLQATVAVAYLLQRFGRCHRVVNLHAVKMAQVLFGEETFACALETVSAALREQGYGAFCAQQSYLPLILAFALLARGSSHLEDLDETLLQRLYRETVSHNHQGAVSRLSYALFTLGFISSPLDTVYRKTTSTSTLTAGVGKEWALWCRRWLETSTLTPEVRKATYRQIMKAGRWLNIHRPDILSPAQWTRELAATFVAAVERMNTVEWTGRNPLPEMPQKPLSPRTKNYFIGALRVFFRDCQRWEWMPVHFNPDQALSTPSSILRFIGPDPRPLAEDIWAKLLWAGLNLSSEDLPEGRARKGMGRAYPLEMVRAVALVWLFSGSRVNEICRLRLGCVRWQRAEGGVGEDVCLLEIPVNKTGSAFWRPVDSVVGRAIANWQAVRPPTGLLPDAKTGERVDLLFAYRDVPLGHGYINEILIPLLCVKAGVPLADARGAITSHRARATIASQLYAARDGMTLTELQQWLGHRVPESTRSYVAVTAAQQARAYQDADYLERNLRRVAVLVDQEAVRSGAAAQGVTWRYFDLGHGYCQYDLFDTCAHRMACARCSFYLPKASSRAQYLEARGNLERMAQMIPLTEEERAAVEEGIEHFERLCDRLAHVPTPDGRLPEEMEDGDAT